MIPTTLVEEQLLSSSERNVLRAIKRIEILYAAWQSIEKLELSNSAGSTTPASMLKQYKAYIADRIKITLESTKLPTASPEKTPNSQ